MLFEEIETLSRKQEELDERLPREAATLQKLGLRLESMEGNPHLAAQHRRLAAEVTRLAAEVKRLRRERSENEAVVEGLSRRLERLRAGRRDDPRAHIREAAEPVPVSEVRFRRVAELWAAFSLSLLLIGVVALMELAPEDAWAGVIVFLIVLVLGESILRATFVRTVNRVAVILALAASVILVLHFWKHVLIGGLLALAVFLILQRVQELRG
jgi:predicted RNase H-like nuclease (RuvC/YqgF family)